MKEIRLTVKETMDRQGITRYELAKRTGISYPTLDGYYKNKVVRYDSFILLKLSDALDCKIQDLIKIE